MGVLLSVFVLAGFATDVRPAERTVLVTGAGLDEPFGVAFDAAGNTYIVEMGGNRVRMARGAVMFFVEADTIENRGEPARKCATSRTGKNS